MSMTEEEKEKLADEIVSQRDKVGDAQRDFDNSTGPVTRYTNDMEDAGTRKQAAERALPGARSTLRDAQGLYDNERDSGDTRSAERARDAAAAVVDGLEDDLRKANSDLYTATSNYNSAARTLDHAQSALLSAKEKLADLESKRGG